MVRNKRSYRSVDVKSLDREKLVEDVKGKRVVFAIDAAKEKYYGSFMTENREKKVIIRWNQIDDHDVLIKTLKELPAKEIVAAMEPTGTYGDPLRYQLQEIGIPTYLISAKKTHDAAEVFDGVPSYHDAKATDIIGKLYWDKVGRQWRDRTELEREMGAVLKVLEIHRGDFERKRNQIEGLLARHWPELTRFLDYRGVTIFELLAEMGGPRLVREKPSQAAELMRQTGRGGLRDSKIAEVVRSAMKTIGVPMIKAEEEALKEIGREARRSQKMLRSKEAEVKRLIKTDDEMRHLKAVVGDVTAAVLLSQVGSIKGYESAKSVEKAIGLNLKVKSSGKCKGQLKITKRGPSLSRMYLYLAVLRLIQRDRIANAWYQRMLQRNGGIKLKAIVAMMRKLIKALWYVAKGEEFDSSKLFNVKMLKVKEA